MKLLNLGCGQRYNNSWTNVDFISTDKNVISHNLLHGIPFENNFFDVVYHSHVLEHFSKTDGKKFIQECFRVLKPTGIIRIAVPDLERIAKEYLKNLELAVNDNSEAKKNYEWIKLELYDQTVRNESGGDMAKYLFNKELPNEQYVFERIGEEGRNLRKMYLNNLKAKNNKDFSEKKNIGIIDSTKSFINIGKCKLKEVLFKKQIKEFKKLEKEAAIGRFRLSGEIHQWMYDRYSLAKLLAEAGFSKPEVKDAFTSNILHWNNYELEAKNGIVYKPDSLFMEAIK